MNKNDIKILIEKIKKRENINLLMLIFLPFILIFLTEYIQKQSINETFFWMSENIGLVFLNYIIIYFIFFMIQTLINKPTISCLLTSITSLSLSLISYLKYEIRGEVLLINDFILVNQAGELISFVQPQMFFKTPIIMAVLFIIFLIIILNLLKIKTNRKKSLFILVFLTIVMYFSFINQYFSTNILKFFGLDTEIRYNINSIHKEKGVILGLYSNVIMNRVQKPLGYSKEKVFEILENMKINEELNDKNNVENNGEEKIKPNVIMIMSESFFDPTVLSNVKFSEDPIPEIRKLLAKYTSGKIISSTFAGGTSNIEFEAFTGNSIAYLPYGTVPYTDLQDSIAEVDSLPKIMKSNGYKTIALHTYDKTFYNRDKNYANIGFDEFIGIDELVNPQYFGKYVSDETFVDNITQILEDNNEPVFIWGVTMQNHTPYNTSNYDMELKIEISGELLTEKAVDTLTAYSNGLYNSDRAMKKLIDYIELSTRPTIILFFGDHLPSLYDVYFDTGLISTKDTTKWTTTEMYNLHTIPFFIYDNFEYKTEYSNEEFIGTLFLGNYLCNYLELEKPIYFKFLDTLTYKAIRDRLFIDRDKNVYEKVQKEYEEMISNHKKLQYDLLYGEKYIREYIINYNKEKS